MSTSEIEPSPFKFEFGHGPTYFPGNLKNSCINGPLYKNNLLWR